MRKAQIAAVRRFNRRVTQRVGALEDHFLGRARPLGQSRVLYEIGRNGADLRDLQPRALVEAVQPPPILVALQDAEGRVVLSDAQDPRRR